MLKSVIGVLMASVLVAGVAAIAGPGTMNDLRTSPIMHSVAPNTVKAGGQLVATGENLGKAAVAQVYLTTGKVDVKVTVTAQTDTSITVVVPAKIAPGQYRLMVLTTTNPPEYMEQPVLVTVE
jgi:IPT/TIG domain